MLTQKENIELLGLVLTIEKKGICQKHRKKFCNAVIQGIRNLENPLEIKFYLKENHSDLCINYFKIIKNTNTLENEILDDKKRHDENIKMNQSISISNISDKKDFYNYLENYMKNNKDLNLE